jgi:uncharacterized protein (TIGR01777 family)
MRIALAGSSGLIGSALVPALQAEGHEVVRLVRRPAARDDELMWDPTKPLDPHRLGAIDAAINLAGVGVGDHRWSTAYKQQIRDSRVVTTSTLATALAAMEPHPTVLINSSAIGWYGDTGETAVDETSPRGEGFLAQVCEEWEAATGPAEDAGIRVVHARTGLVVSNAGGAWKRMTPLFKTGVGGRLGTGKQFWSWISIEDQIGAMMFALTRDSLRGPVNFTAPSPMRNSDVTAAMGRVLGRPTPFPVPASALRIGLGEFASETLGSQRVLPTKLLAQGFTFRYPDFESAYRAALAA